MSTKKRHSSMKRILKARLKMLLPAIMLSTTLTAQTNIAVQDFETTPASPTWTYTNTGGVVSATNTGTPNGQRVRTGTRSLQINNNNGTQTFADINVSAYTGVKVIVRLSSISATATQGADASDFVRAFVKLNAAAFPTNTEANADIAVNGNTNARWSYNTTGATTNAGSNLVVAGTSGTDVGTIYSTLTINIPAGTNTVGLRLDESNNQADEIWCIDDIAIVGTAASPCATPSAPTGLTLALNATNPTIAIDGTFNAPVTAPSEYLVVRSTNSTLSAGPADGTVYALNAALGGGTVIAKPTLSSTGFASTGLTPGTQYYYFVYSVITACTGTPPLYSSNTGVTLSGSSTTQPEDGIWTAGCATNTTLNLSFSAPTGNYDGLIILAKQGSIPGKPTADANTITGASTDFSIAGSYNTSTVLYNGSVAGAANLVYTGFTQSMPYTFKAFTFKNSAGTIYSNGTQITRTIKLPDVTSITANGGNTTASIGLTNPPAACFDEVLVVASVGAPGAVPVGDGTAYTANAAYGAGNTLGTGFVVYKGTGNTASVTALTNNTAYTFTAFVRKGTEWSPGSSTTATPNSATIFDPGDFAIIGVNTATLSSGSADQICFFSFKDITPNTSFDVTDNGYERAFSGKWGNTEGFITLTRKATAPTIAKGTPICINGPDMSYDDANINNYDIFVDGVKDDANWIFTSASGGTATNTPFDLNNTDQVWFMQGGSWSSATGVGQDAVYSGKLMYGWTATGWKSNIGNTAPTWTTAGSRLPVQSSCFNTDVTGVSNPSKVKYTGVKTAATKLQWIMRIKNASNWTGYASNSAYNGTSAATNYNNQPASVTGFTINTSTETAGLWRGTNNNNWFDCSNWDNFVVPDTNTNVIIDASSTSLNKSFVSSVAAFSDLSNDTARCHNLTISDNEVNVEGSDLNRLLITGDMIISGNGVVDASDGNNSTPDGQIILQGNWTNNLAETEFKQGNSTLILTGTNNQIIQNTVSPSERFYNLTLNKPAGTATLSTSSSIIENTAAFTNGVLNTNSSALLIFDAGSMVGAGADAPKNASHVAGPVLKIGNTAFSFPIGKGGKYRPAGIAATAAITDQFSAEYFNTIHPSAGRAFAPFSNPGFPGMDHVSHVEYWDIHQENGTTNKPDVTLTFDNKSGVWLNPTTANLVVAHFNGINGWDNLGSTNISGTANAGSITAGTSTLSGFSPFTLGSPDPAQPLPLKIITFTGKYAGANALQLSWSTSCETNMASFAVEKSNGDAFHETGSVVATNNGCSTKGEYQFTDSGFNGQIQLYRIRMSDLNGNKAYSNTLSFKSGNLQETPLTISPNPAGNSITIIGLKAGGAYQILDASGRIVALNTASGVIENVAITNLPSGIYFVKIINGQSLKFLKQ